MALARAKLQSDTSTEFEAARTRWQQVNAEWQGRLQTIRAIQVALSLAISPTEADSDRCTWARGIAADHLAMARRQPKKLRQQLEELEFQVEEQQPAYMVEADSWEQAQRRETTRQALEYQPRQQAAVKEIAKALEALSRAIAAEREVRSEFAARAPLGRSPYLPDASSDLVGFGDLGRYNSVGSKWGKKMLEIEVLK